MNLFYNPSIVELRQLVDCADKSLQVNNIVIDFDGEVIIDPEMKYKGIDLDRFKFRAQVSQAVKTNAKSLKGLFEILMAAYYGSNADMYIMKNAA